MNVNIKFNESKTPHYLQGKSQTSAKDTAVKQVISANLEVVPERIKRAIDEYLELRRKRNNVWQNRPQRTVDAPQKIDPKMERIMSLVQANSQTVLVHNQIIDIGKWIFT